MNRASLVDTFQSALMAMPKWLVLLVALVFVAIIGWFDYTTGSELDASALYVLPISLVVFRTDARISFAFALLCAVVWWLAQLEDAPYQTVWGLALAAVTMMFYFTIVVAAGVAMKSQWELARARIKILERAQHLENEKNSASEQERQRIGRELHDGLCQTLAGIAALSATLSSRLSTSPQSDASAAAAEITKLLNEAIGEARDLAHGLGPVGQQDTDVPAVLDHLARNVQHRFGVPCSLECEGHFPRLRREVVSHLLRITQEALNNAVAHGRVERIEIGLSSADGEGRLRICDDGVGIPEAALQGGGIGLATMAYRARLIGGSFDVQRHSPHGTAVTCVFPLLATPNSAENPDHARGDN